MLHALVSQLVDLMHQGTWKEVKARSRSDAVMALRYLEQHRLVFQAIATSDPLLARQTMVLHLDTIESGILHEVDRDDASSR